MENKLYIHGLGGAGIRVATKLHESFGDGDEGTANIIHINMDTSLSNKSVCTGELNVVESKLINAEVNGSGANRKTHANDISSYVKVYMDHYGISEQKNNEFHIMIASASGGSGSVILPYLTKEFGSRNIPVVAILIADDSDLVSIENTIATIKTMDRVASSTNIALPMFIGLNNDDWSNIDKSIIELIETIAVFVSGENMDIDNQDMQIMFDQTKHATQNIPAGVYGLKCVFGKSTVKYDYPVTIMRTLTVVGVSPVHNIETIHTKSGRVIVGDDTMDTVRKYEQISLLTINGALPTALESLETTQKKLSLIKDKLADPTKLSDEDDLMVF